MNLKKVLPALITISITAAFMPSANAVASVAHEQSSEADSVASAITIEVKHWTESYADIDSFHFVIPDMGDYYNSESTSLCTSSRLTFEDFIAASSGEQDESLEILFNNINFDMFKNLNGIDAVYNELRSYGDIPTSTTIIIYEKDGEVQDYSISMNDDYSKEDSQDISEEEQEEEIEDTEAYDETEGTEETEETKETEAIEEIIDDTANTPACEDTADNIEEEINENIEAD
jgi:hypothetical protein